MDDPAVSRVEKVFEEAAGLAGEERSALLSRECRGDEALRNEVESLLSEHDAGADFLETPPSTVGRARAAGSLPRSEGSAGEEAGTRIGPYRLLRVLGRGGMGTVWLARQEEPVRREVALKIVQGGTGNAEVLARFEAERQALALMDHPNVAHVFDGRVTDRGRPYFVMEYVPGPPITEHCDRGRLPLKERLDLFVQVCEAVEHAHRKGVIHRDLKPSNILVADVDGRPLPKVIDFGVAKATGKSLTDRTLHTLKGELIGTPEYMAPEAALLGGSAADTRSDVYSLGVVLYELLTGALPFDPGVLRSAGPAEMWRLVREVDPPRPSTRLRGMAALPPPPADAPSGDAPPSAPASRAKGPEEVALARRTNPVALVRALRGDLDWIVMKALERDPERRYGSVADLAEDVRRHLAHEPVSAGPPGAGYRLRKFVRRNRALVAGVVAVFVSLAGGLVATRVMYFRAVEERKRTGNANQLAQMRLQAVLGAISDSSGRASDAWQLAEIAGSARLRECIARDAVARFHLFGGEVPFDPVGLYFLGYTYQGLGESLLALGRTAEALASHVTSVGYREALVRSFWGIPTGDRKSGSPVRALAVGLWRVGDTLMAMGRPEGALPEYRRAFEIHERQGGIEPCIETHRPVYIGSGHRRIAEALAAMARSEEALPSFHESLDLVVFGLEIEPENAVLQRDRILTMSGLGDALLATGRVAESAIVLEQALSFAEEWNQAVPPANVWERTNLARCALSLAAALTAEGRATEAAAVALRAVALAEALSGTDPDNFESRHLLGRSLAELAWHQAEAGLPSEALATFDRGIGHLEAVVAKDPDNALARRDLGIACFRQGGGHRARAAKEAEGSRQAEEWRRARSWYERGVETLRTLQREGLLLAQIAPVLGQLDAALARCDEAIAGFATPARPEAAFAAR
ncbi:MAG TPA: serine/threonine-protein kinase [Planctomycetota bacterium]|jgi:serine/threonine protein kinase|nr:serine/threonine-protein kinase [Planctomycetota bacterium]